VGIGMEINYNKSEGKNSLFL